MEENEISHRNRRKLKNLLLQPKNQLSASLTLFLVGFIVISLLFGVVIFGVTETIKMFAQLVPASEDIEQISEGTQVLLWITYGILMMSFLFSSLFFGALITHRYIGPIVPIQRQIKKLIRGDYSGTIVIRKKDQFQDLAADVNQLTEKLRSEQTKTGL